MTGRREQQKAKRRKSILNAALTMFTEQGYEAVKLEEIAKNAGVSPGTIYIYFKTKNDLLLAIIVEDFETVFEQASMLVVNENDTTAQAVNNLCELLIFQDSVYVPPSLWRAAISAYIGNPSSHFAKAYGKCLIKTRKCFHDVVAELVEKELLPASTEQQTLANLLYNQYNMNFLEYIQTDGTSVENYGALLFKMNQYILKETASQRS